MKKNFFQKNNSLRNFILLIILLGTIVLNFLHIHIGNQYPSVHALCPFGGLENLWSFLGSHTNIQKIFSGTMTLFFLTLVYTLIFGRSFCGNLCPFGALFEFINKFSKKKIEIPIKIDKYLRYLKYFFLVFVTFMAWKTATIWISPYDPYAAFAHISSGTELFSEMPIAAFILAVILVASLFINRFFCRYLCPAGALYALLSKISFLKIKRNPCLNCGACTRTCPMGIDVKNSKEIKGGECVACGQCIDTCPDSSKYIGFFLFNKKIKTFNFIIISVVAFFISILVLNSFGLFRLSIPTLDTVQQTQEYISIPDLKGSMSIDIAAQYAGKNLDEFYKIMEIPDTIPSNTLLKDISTFVPGYDFHVVKTKNQLK